MPSITLYHNPRCSKSRATLELLREKGINPNIRLYLEQPLSEDEIRNLLTKLQMSAIEIIRSKEEEFKALGLSKNSDEQTLINAMVSTPKLIERPIAETETAAAIGRPPENVLELLA